MNIYNYQQPINGEETIETLLSKSNITINHIISNNIQNGQWYDQDEDEWLVLITGEAVLNFGDEEVTLHKGDTFFIQRHRRHYVKKTSEDALWLTVHIS